jgi:hypothetical protein
LKAKTIKALDTIIAGLEELKVCIEAVTTKSGGGADDEDTGEVPRRGKPAKAAAVPAARKKSRAVPDDDDELDGDADGDGEEGDDDDDLPPAKPAAKKVAAKKAPAKKAAADDGDDEFETVRASLTKVMNVESLGKPRVLKILKKYGAERAADLDAGDYAAVLKLCKAALAEADDDV